MNKNLLSCFHIIILLLSACKLRAQQGYFRCVSKMALYELVVSDTTSTHDALWIGFRFIDTLGAISTKVCPAWMLYKQLKGKMPRVSPYANYRKVVLDALLTNKPLTQRQWGDILAYDVTADSLVAQTVSRGLEAFVDHFFEHRNAFKEWDYNAKRPQVVAAAFDFGLLMRLSDGINYLYPVCNCRLKKVLE
jgi:hypothetical protein